MKVARTSEPQWNVGASIRPAANIATDMLLASIDYALEEYALRSEAAKEQANAFWIARCEYDQAQLQGAIRTLPAPDGRWINESRGRSGR